jgi:hypothetical protein
MAEIRQTDTRDIGLAIRDFMQGFAISQFHEVEGELEEVDSADKVDFVDVSDPHNPVLHMESGIQFTVRVVRTG